MKQLLFPQCFTCFQRCQVRPVDVQSRLLLRNLGMANSLHVRLFDCLRAISGNQVLHGQELPCNNYGVKWQLATQEGICLLAAPSCSAEVRGHRLFRKSPFLKQPETGGGWDRPVYSNSMQKMGKIKPTYILGTVQWTF